METVIQNSVYAWYYEILDAPLSVVSGVHFVPSYDIGHFLIMTHDMAQRVGCSASQWDVIDKFGTNKFTRITCNYYKSPLLGQPLYKAGDTCGDCVDTCDYESELAGLCDLDPQSFANTYKF